MLENTDIIASEILAKVLEGTGYSHAVLFSDRSPRNVRARELIYALMRSCEHPDCAQLSLRRIGKICAVDAANVRHRIRKFGELQTWKFDGPLPQVKA
jgi:hypothetical protein